MNTAIIATCLNERDNVDRFVNGILSLHRLPDKVVVIDAGSKDGTWERLVQVSRCNPTWVVRQLAGAGRSEGRNYGARLSDAAILAFTDFGCQLDPGWLTSILAPIEAGATTAVSGFFRPAGTSARQRIIASIQVPHLSEIVDPSRFEPSSRSMAITRDAFELAGGYPEWVNTSEDLVFNAAVRESGHSFMLISQAIVYWYTPSTLKGMLRQYRGYARGDRRADLYRGRHTMRLATYMFWLSMAIRPTRAGALLSGLVAVAYLRRTFLRLKRHGILSDVQLVGAIPYSVAAVVAGDAGKLIGYWVDHTDRFDQGPTSIHKGPLAARQALGWL